MYKLNKPVIFIRKAKCAGTSIENVLYENNIGYLWDPQVKYGKNLSTYFKDRILIVYGRDFNSFLDRNLDFYNKSFKFSTMRNPWDKFICSWKYCNEMDNFFKNKTLKEVLLNLPDENVHKHHYWHITKLQSDIITLNDDIKMDFFIRFEKLQEDFDSLCDLIGIEKNKLPHLHKTVIDHYSKYFDNETNKIFTKKYKKDIEYFGYKF